MRLAESTTEILAVATRRARERRQPFCSAEQVLETALDRLGHRAAAIEVGRRLDARPGLPFDPPASELSRSVAGRLLPAAAEHASREGAPEVAPIHLLGVLLAATSPVDLELRERVSDALGRVEEPDLAAPSQSPVARTDRLPEGLRLVENVPSESDLVDRDDIVERVARTLLYGSALVLGPVGSGRRSVLRLLVRLLRADRCPPGLRGARLFELDPTALVAGTAYRGELEKRIQSVIEAVERGGAPGVLIVPDVHLLVGKGEGIDAATALAPVLKRGSVRLVGCTTHDEHRERIEDRPAFADSLNVVPMPAIDLDSAARLLAGLPLTLERDFGVRVHPEISRASAELCVRHLPHLALPGVAATVARRAAATLAFERAMLASDRERLRNAYWEFVAGGRSQPEEDGGVGARHLIHAIADLHGMPLDHLQAGASSRLAALESALRAEVFGQDHALDVLVRTVKVVLANLASPGRPRGRLFFVGPPGTGKSECARLLAEHLMGRSDAFLRFDMSEFQEPSSVSTLIGSDKGLVGSDEGGRLTEPLRENPRRVVLFDEIEKANPAVFHLFLQILEYGEIHDKRGRRVSFRHALCIFTSNAACGPEQGMFGLDRPQMIRRLREVFRPEFLDRLDELIPFRTLDNATRRRIAELQLTKLARQVEVEHPATLVWDDDVLQAGSIAPDGEVGARHVLRWIQGEVKPAIADLLLSAGGTVETALRIVLRATPSGGVEATC